MGNETREGNPIAPMDCTLRNEMRDRAQSVCADCVHILDTCWGIKKQVTTHNGFNSVISCNGFEK